MSFGPPPHYAFVLLRVLQVFDAERLAGRLISKLQVWGLDALKVFGIVDNRCFVPAAPVSFPNLAVVYFPRQVVVAAAATAIVVVAAAAAVVRAGLARGCCCFASGGRQASLPVARVVLVAAAAAAAATAAAAAWLTR